jgi:hypothetical protein
MKKLIAKTLEGKEYFHSREDSFFAFTNAQKIANILNQNKWKLQEGEKWHVYDYDFMQEDYVMNSIYITNKGQLKTKAI